jgi:hypothetical protein
MIQDGGYGRAQKEVVMAYFRYHISIYLECLLKTTENLTIATLQANHQTRDLHIKQQEC